MSDLVDEQPAASKPVRTSAPAPTDAVVDAWFSSNFYGLPISTDLFNRFQTAKELLKEQLRAPKE